MIWWASQVSFTSIVLSPGLIAIFSFLLAVSMCDFYYFIFPQYSLFHASAFAPCSSEEMTVLFQRRWLAATSCVTGMKPLLSACEVIFFSERSFQWDFVLLPPDRPSMLAKSPFSQEYWKGTRAGQRAWAYSTFLSQWYMEANNGSCSPKTVHGIAI